MKPNDAIHRLFNIKCAEEFITRKEAIKFFGVSWQFLLSVLTYKTPCPEWLVPKLAEYLKMPPAVIGTAFGYMPEGWHQMARENPLLLHETIHTVLKEVNAGYDPELCVEKRIKLLNAIDRTPNESDVVKVEHY